MGAFEGRRGPWGLATDVIYLDLGATKKETREFSIGEVGLPADVSADLKLGLTGGCGRSRAATRSSSRMDCP